MRNEDPARTAPPNTQTAPAGTPDDTVARRTLMSGNGSEARRPEAHEELNEPTPEEAGYGYGV